MARYCSSCKQYNQAFPLMPSDAKSCLRCRARHEARRVALRRLRVDVDAPPLDIPGFLPMPAPERRDVALVCPIGYGRAA